MDRTQQAFGVQGKEGKTHLVDPEFLCLVMSDTVPPPTRGVPQEGQVCGGLQNRLLCLRTRG